MASKSHLITAFSKRPSLAGVALQALNAELRTQFPTMTLNPQKATVVSTAKGAAVAGETLLAALRTDVATGRAPRWSSPDHTLIADITATTSVTLALDMAQLAIAIDSVSVGLLDTFNEALVVFWDTPAANGLRPGEQLAQALEQQYSVAAPAKGEPVPGSAAFQQKALNVLQAQLQAVRRAPLRTLGDFDEIERYLAKLTDISPLLKDGHSENIGPKLSRFDQLPVWMTTASPADRLDYSRRLAALAAVAENAQGRAWDDDLPPILDYARQALQDSMLSDHPEATWLTLDDVTVHIDKVVAAPVPLAGQFIAVGDVEKLQSSVAAFALGNLSSIPSGTITLTLRNGGPLPGWLTVGYLKQLISRVDIGAAYPARVRRCLISDRTQVTQRQTLFAEQLRVQLPLKALEQKIRGQGNLSLEGYRSVCAIMEQSDAMELRADGRVTSIVIRALAWVAKPGWAPDVVSNMFVLGPDDRAMGPFVLYRPFAQLPLTEFATWAALRDAIVQPGELQNEVLAWLPASARQRYANGGFDQPHITRFGQGSDFAPLETPAAAQLAEGQIEGDLMQTLFAANARALADLADSESVSNAQSRWNMLQRGGWLALECVMPFLSGAAGSAVWLVQLMSSVDKLLAMQGRKASSEERQAWGSLLLTVSMILMHQGFRGVREVSVRSEPLDDAAIPQEGTEAPASGAQEPESAETTVVSDVAQGWDFSWSSVNHRLTSTQLQQLQALKISPAPVLGPPSQASGRAGLYQQGEQWRARLDGDVYAVKVVGEQVYIVDPQNPTVMGPRLKYSNQTWQLDLSLKLRGGGPKRNARQVAQENAAALKRVQARDAVLKGNKAALYRKFVGWDTTCKRATGQVPAAIYDLIEVDLNELKGVAEERIQLQQSLRPVDRLDDKDIADDLQGVARRVAFLEGVLLQNAVKLAHTQLIALHALADGKVTPANVDLYFTLFEDLLALQERAVRWSEVREGLWERLRAVPRVGESVWRDEVQELQDNHLYSHLAWRMDRMWSLLELSFGKQDILSGFGDRTLKALRNDDTLHAAFSSHAELDKPNDYTLAERVAVLESSLDEYQRANLIVISARDNPVMPLNSDRFERFVKELSWLIRVAQRQLSELVRESAELQGRPLNPTPIIKQPRKRVIRTRSHRTLVGRLREGEPDLPGAVVDITRARGDVVIETYHLHENGEWVETAVAQAPAPSSAQPTVALAELKQQANAALKEVQPAIDNARRQSTRVYEPADVESILTMKGEALKALADTLDAKRGAAQTTAQPTNAIQALVNTLRNESARLVLEGRALRIAMIKAQPPTAARLSYLASEKEVNIARYEGRKNMSGAKRNDFLQEYVIRDTGQQILWWAHFHYSSEAAPPDSFTAAHLKLPAQRFIGYKAQLKAAREDKDVVAIYRSYIGKEVAQRLFLALAPSTQGS